MCQAMIDFFMENEHMRQTMQRICKEDENACQTMMWVFKDQIDELVDKASDKSREEGEEKGILLAKQVLRLNADGEDYETIASKCMLTVDEVKDILNY